MEDGRTKLPHGGKDGDEKRKARLAAELRANLARRKAQTRARRAGAADERSDGLPLAGPAERDSR